MATNEDIDWEFIIDTIREGKCVLFLGPEALTDEDGSSIKKELIEELDPENNPLILSYYPHEELFLFGDETDKTKIYYKIKRFYKKQDIPDIYQKLARIPFHIIVSINPDGFMGEALEKLGVDYIPETYWKFHSSPKVPIKPSPTVEQPFVYNLFGHIDEIESMVLTHNDMFDYLKSVLGEFSLPEDLEIRLQKAEDFIFIGFDFDKWYVQLLMRLLSLHNGKVKSARYASNKGLSEGTRKLCREQFKIEFANHEIDNFVEELYSHCQGILRDVGDTKTDPLEQVESQIEQADLDGAMETLKGYIEAMGDDGEDYQADLIGLRSQYSRAKKREHEGVIDEKEAAIAYNKARVALTDLVKELKAFA